MDIFPSNSRSGQLDSGDAKEDSAAPARQGFGQLQHGKASASNNTARLRIARSKQGFGQLERSEASAQLQQGFGQLKLSAEQQRAFE